MGHLSLFVQLTVAIFSILGFLLLFTYKETKVIGLIFIITSIILLILGFSGSQKSAICKKEVLFHNKVNNNKDIKTKWKNYYLILAL